MQNESKHEDDSHVSNDINDENNNEEESAQHEENNDNYINEENDNTNFVDEYDHTVHHSCFNCHRRQSTLLQEQFGQSYQIEYFDLRSTNVKTRRKFKLCNINYNNPNESQYILPTMQSASNL